MEKCLEWMPIQDLPKSWSTFVNQDLSALASVWKERESQLKNTEQLLIFNQRLIRAWSIETGIIERLYSIDRGITEILIAKGIETSLIPSGTTDKSPTLIVSIIQDQQSVIEGLFDFVAQRRILSNSYIKQIHQVFTRNQDTTTGVDPYGNIIEIQLIKGDWKKWPNNPKRQDGTIHEYCPPEQTASEMDRLIKMHSEHNLKKIPPEIEAAWLHHRFTQIHPFQDGNGRVARALASLIFLKEGWFPLVISNENRSEYITACEYADCGDLSPLVKLFSKIEISAFRNALSISDDLPSINPTIEKLISEKRVTKQNHLFEISKKLEEITTDRLRSVASDIDKKLSLIDHDYWSSVSKSTFGENDHWYRSQIITIANNINYYANLHNYRAWVQLKIHEERIANITFSFHSLGASTNFLGIMAVSAFLEFRDANEEDQNYEGPIQICEDIFQFSNQDREIKLIEKFNHWLGEVVLFGLSEWQRRI
jgi:Fic family protein